MFELSVAFKYLMPRLRQLSVSVISLISILVIALVVWLIVVFFSVTHGLEKNWVQKLIAFTAPVRVTPTAQYYNSYYYLIDSVSAESNYTLKSIGEKLAAPQTDPYDPQMDEEVPGNWPKPEPDKQGELLDPVKTAFAILGQIPGIQARAYEMTVATLKLRSEEGAASKESDKRHAYSVYIGSYDPDNKQLKKSLLPLTDKDVTNLSVNIGDAAPALLVNNKLPERLPSDFMLGEAVLLPKGYREAGILAGDRGAIAYQAPTAVSVQELSIPVYIAGFYDPGIMPLAGKIVLTNPEVPSIVRSAYPHEESPFSNGINVRFDDLASAETVKKEIEDKFAKAGIAKYWKVETFREFDFTKDFLQQLHSERNLFTLISTIIILVACSNIVSMLIILVNNKKIEIGILRAMGATSRSIAIIFGVCGVVMGLLGSLIGVLAAVLTLRNLQGLIDLISRLQGFEAFNPVFYGDTLPNEVSVEALAFVMGTTAVISLIAGIVPAVKACLMRPSAILRME